MRFLVEHAIKVLQARNNRGVHRGLVSPLRSQGHAKCVLHIIGLATLRVGQFSCARGSSVAIFQAITGLNQRGSLSGG